MTFAEDLEREAADLGEVITKVVIGGFGWSHGEPDDKAYGIDDSKVIPEDQKRRPLSWEKARPLLDYAYSTGYGAPDCHAVWAYTAHYVLFVVQYDGSTAIHAIPRSPTKGLAPEMPGG